MNIVRLATLLAVAAGLGACTGPGDRQTALNREQHACAAMGFDPGEARFTDCVADLDSSVLQSEGDQQR
jgi:hypothetical protein